MAILKFTCKETKIIKTRFEEFPPPDLKTFCKVTLLKIVWYLSKDRHIQSNSPEERGQKEIHM
jgi:hypothetical protein